MQRHTVWALGLWLTAGAGWAAAGTAPEAKDEKADKRERKVVKIVSAGDEDEAAPRRVRRVEVRHAFGSGAYLGVQLAEVGGDDVSKLGLSEERGARVTEVVADSPAAKAGLAENDVIVGFGGESVRSALQLQRLVRETPPGREVEVDVVRAGRSQKLSVELDRKETARAEGPAGDMLFDLPLGPGELPALPEGGPHKFAWRGRPGETLPDLPALMQHVRPRRLGVRYQDIEGQLARYFGVEGERGVLVTDVDDEGAAGRAGVKAGDVILKLGGHDVKDGDDLRQALDRSEGGQELPLVVWRSGKRVELQVKLPGDARHARERHFD